MRKVRRTPFRRGAIVLTSALVLAPWAVLAAIAFGSTEPRFPPPPTRNANGTPAIVAAVPPGMKGVHARFDLPVLVDAVRIFGPHPIKTVEMDLWLRRTGAIPRTTGMFVHVIRHDSAKDAPPPEDKDAPRDFFNVDHQVVGGSFYLSDAPAGETIHDAFGLFVGKAVPGRYDVMVGSVTCRGGEDGRR